MTQNQFEQANKLKKEIDDYFEILKEPDTISINIGGYKSKTVYINKELKAEIIDIINKHKYKAEELFKNI